jgi:hypothetical protein
LRYSAATGGDAADALREHATVPQLVVIQEPPDLSQPGLDERAVVVASPCLQQGDAFQAQQIGKWVLIDDKGRR